MAEAPPGKLSQRIRGALDGPPAVMAWAPGRINIIGGHTDYTGGLALPAAIDAHVVVGLRPRMDGVIQIRALDLGGVWTGAAEAVLPPKTGWARTMAGAVRVFADAHGLPGGFEAAVAGDVPQGAGVSSSAALCVAWMNAMATWAGTPVAPLDLARLAQRVEHQWSGVPCGLLDQLASQCASPSGPLRVDFRSLETQAVRWTLADHGWLLLHTGTTRQLAHSGYGQRVAQVRAGLAAVQAITPEVGHWRDLQPQHLRGLDPILAARLAHGMAENARVDQAIAAIRDRDPWALGALLVDSHQSLRAKMAVSSPALDAMVAAATAAGALGARMMGGGFGGCVLALVPTAGAAEISAAAQARYAERTGQRPRGWVLRLGPGSGAVEL